MNNKWYVATLILQIKVGKGDQNLRTCDEQVRLLRSPDRDTAYDKAIALGKSEEASYENAFGESVSWEFVGLEDLEELSPKSLRDGIEIRSRLFRHKDPSRLVRDKDSLYVYMVDRDKRQTDYKVINDREPFDGD